MTSANVELARSVCAAWAGGDFSRAAEWAHPDIEYVFADGPSPGTWTGLAGMADHWRDWLAEWQDFRAEADNFRDLDDERVLAFGYYSGRGKTSGLQVGQMTAGAASLFHIRDGKVTRLVNYFDCDRAFADLGLASEAGAN